MLGRIVKRDPAIEMRTGFRDVAREQQGRAHEALGDHDRDRVPLLLGERQEMGREIATNSAIEPDNFATQMPYRTENNNSGSSGRSPRASACSIMTRARSAAALGSGAANPLTCMSGVMSAT